VNSLLAGLRRGALYLTLGFRQFSHYSPTSALDHGDEVEDADG
jgi:hypothetical protein